MKELDFLPGRLLFSKCDPFISSVSTIREFVRNADSQAQSQICCIGNAGSGAQQPGVAQALQVIPMHAELENRCVRAFLVTKLLAHLG